MLRAIVVVFVLAGCFRARAFELDPPLAPFAWMLGDWRDARNTTAVVGAPGAIYLVNFNDTDTDFDVKIIDDTSGDIWLFHPMDGRPPDRATNVRAARVIFVGPNKSTTTLRHYPRMGFEDGTIADSLLYGADEVTIVQLRRYRAARSSVIERADLELSKATRDHGPSSWAAGFADDGALWTAADGWLRGRKAIEHAFAATSTFSWEPSNSRLAPHGKLALTTGRFTRRTPDGRVEQGSYLSVWKLATRGQWKVVFSTRQGG